MSVGARPGALAVFSLHAGRPLLERICRQLGIEPGRHEEREFEDGEHKIRSLQSVRGRDVYLVQALFGDAERSVDDKLARTLFFLAALRDAGAARVTAVLPYLCYARKDRRTKPRDPVTSRYVAMLLEAVGIDRVVTIDTHNEAAFDNAFRIPTAHLTAIPSFVDVLAPLCAAHQTVVVSPDAGGVKRAERFRQALEARLARSVGLAFVEKFRSEGVVRGGTVVGKVTDRVAIIIDDLISSGSTLARAGAACLERGARTVYAAATHGVLSAAASEVLGGSALQRIVLLDTIPLRADAANRLHGRLELVDCAPLLASAIERLHTDGSIVELCG